MGWERPLLAAGRAALLYPPLLLVGPAPPEKEL